MASNNKIDDVLLIRLVEKERILHDPSYNKLVDLQKKDELWNEIGSIMGCNKLLCKSRWTILRDGYRKALKRAQAGANAGGPLKHRYAKLLYFLDEHYNKSSENASGDIFSHIDKEKQNLIDRARQNIIPVKSVPPNYYKENLHYTYARSEREKQILIDRARQNMIYENIPRPNESLQGAPLSRQNIENILAGPHKQATQKLANPCSNPVGSRKQLNQQKPEGAQDSACSILMQYIMNKDETLATSQSPVDAFLAGLAPTLKTFSPYFLNLARSKIFTAIQEVEMDMLREKNGTKSNGAEVDRVDQNDISFSSTDINEENIEPEIAPVFVACDPDDQDSYLGPPLYVVAEQMQAHNDYY